MLTLGGRADKNCDSHFSPQESTAQTDSVTWPRSHRKAWVNIRSQASWWDCNVSGASVFLGCTQPCYLPLPTDTASSLSSDELSPVYLWKPAPPLGRWIPAPLKDVVHVIALSFLYEVHFPPPIRRQTRYNLPRPKKQTNPPLSLHPFHICLLSLLSLTQEASKTVYTAHVSPQTASVSKTLPTQRAFVKSLVHVHLRQPSAAFVTADHSILAMLSSFDFGDTFSWFSSPLSHFSWLLLHSLTLPQVIFFCLLP